MRPSNDDTFQISKRIFRSTSSGTRASECDTRERPGWAGAELSSGTSELALLKPLATTGRCECSLPMQLRKEVAQSNPLGIRYMFTEHHHSYIMSSILTVSVYRRGFGKGWLQEPLPAGTSGSGIKKRSRRNRSFGPTGSQPSQIEHRAPGEGSRQISTPFANAAKSVADEWSFASVRGSYQDWLRAR